MDDTNKPCQIPKGLVDFSGESSDTHSDNDPLVETKLRELQQRCELCAAGTSDGIWDWDLATGTVWYSDLFLRILGYARDEWPATVEAFNEHLHPEDIKRTWEAVDRHFKGEPFDVAYRLKRKDGNFVWFRSRGTSTRDGDGRPLRMAGSIQSIDERKRVEAELRKLNEALQHEAAERIAAQTMLEKLNEDLESRVEARTRELKESLEQLRDSEKRNQEYTRELERQNQDLDEFAYVASHDLKAPLRGIRSVTGWLREDCVGLLPEASQGHLDDLQNRVDRMERLLAAILEYARAGRYAETRLPVDTGALVRNIIESFESNHAFEINLPDDMPVLDTAAEPLLQVFQNLIGNAIKHHDCEEGRVSIGWRGEGNRVHFSVHDNGPGIDPRFHKKIFQMFQTLRPRDEVEGSGIGLAIVRRVVESQGGVVRIDSALGRGTTFHFTWPGYHGKRPNA